MLQLRLRFYNAQNCTANFPGNYTDNCLEIFYLIACSHDAMKQDGSEIGRGRLVEDDNGLARDGGKVKRE